MGVNPVDIHGYQPPWKALSEFALHQDLDRMDPSGPQFQHLVGQVTINTSIYFSSRGIQMSKAISIPRFVCVFFISKVKLFFVIVRCGCS